MSNFAKRVAGLRERLAAAVVDSDLGSMGAPRAWMIKALRILYGLVRSLWDEQLMLWTMSLVYTTVLSLIPLLAVSFSLLKAFNLEARMEAILISAFEPLGPAGIEIAQRVAMAVERLEVGLLGALGFIFLFYKSIFLIYKMERALNYIWRVESTRNLVRRFGDYLLILLVGPVLVFTAIGITFALVSTTLVQWVLAIRLLGPLIYAAGELISYVIVSLVFTFIYVLLPDVRVRVSSALAGGFFAGAAWEAAGWAFAAFTVTSAEYSIVYSSFAIPILFLLWLYVAWFVLLLGGQVAFHHQNPQLVAAGPGGLPVGCRLDHGLLLSIMFLIGRNFHQRLRPWKAEQLARQLMAPPEAVRNALSRLEQRGLIISARGAYLPSGDLKRIEVTEILEAVRAGAGDAERAAAVVVHPLPEVQPLLDRLDRSLQSAVEPLTLEDLVVGNIANG